MKRGGGKQKGSRFERETCHQLSRWWTDGKRDDIFWRTAGSGARAQTRGKTGRSTHGQHGDICAIDPIGAPLIDLFTIELKCGYPHCTIGDALDRPKTTGKSQWELWIDQVKRSWEQSGSYSWLLITKRSRRETLVFMPQYVLDHSYPMEFDTVIKIEKKHKGMRPNSTIVGIKFNEWLTKVLPKSLTDLSQKV